MPDGFEAFYRGEYHRTVALVRALCSSWAVAEEVTQEAFIAAYRRWTQVADLDDPGGWVRRVATNQAVSGHRRGRAEERALGRVGAPVELVEPPGPGVGLLTDLGRLPAKQRLAIAAVYVDGLDHEAAAALVGCSASTLRTHLQRGRARLRTIQEERRATDGD